IADNNMNAIDIQTIPATPQNTLVFTQGQSLSFWKYETKMIIIGATCFVISCGCITILIMEPDNCPLSNASYSILGSIIGLLTGLNSNRVKSCSRNDSI
ncbi:MAG TPA: hypothetical protein V6C58_24410, partial [Allocoleopsis sp.]